jgi:hypothetical protein
MRRYTLTRDSIVKSWIPADAVKVCDKNSDAIAYIYTNKKGLPAAAVFYGKQAKPVAYEAYRDEEARAKRVAAYFAARKQRAEMVKGWRADRKEPHGLQVGDVFATHWGYDQTNVEHYEIRELHGATMATVQRIKSHSVETGFMQGKCSPDFGNFIGEPHRVKLSKNGFSIDGHHASKVAVTNIGGVKVGASTGWTAYA